MPSCICILNRRSFVVTRGPNHKRRGTVLRIGFWYTTFGNIHRKSSWYIVMFLHAWSCCYRFVLSHEWQVGLSTFLESTVCWKWTHCWIMRRLLAWELSQHCFQIAKFMGPTSGPHGTCRPQMGPMLAPWTINIAIRVLKGRSGEQSDDDLSYQQIRTASNNVKAANILHWYNWV